MDDRHAQYLILIGDIFLTAATGDLGVNVRLTNGRVLSGVPTARHAHGHAVGEVDDTGYHHRLHVNGIEVELEDVVMCSVEAPYRG